MVKRMKKTIYLRNIPSKSEVSAFSEVIASLEVIEVNEVIDDTFCDSFQRVSMSVTIVVNFERSDNFANFVNFKNIQLAKLESNYFINLRYFFPFWMYTPECDSSFSCSPARL